MAADENEPDPLLVAIVALLVEQRQVRAGEDDLKPEVLLHNCGLSNHLIAQVLNKQLDAVRKTISRAASK